MARYAEGTQVAPETSRAEIERTLNRFGADAFMYAQDGGKAVVAFRARGRQVRFIVTMPDPGERRFRMTPERGLPRSDAAAREAWQGEIRRRWRSLALAIKAKLDAVESGITTFEQEFLPHTVLPDGRTVAQWAEPQVAHAYETGEMPQLLPGIPDDLPQLEGPKG